MLVIGVLAGALITTAAYAPELRRISRGFTDARRDGRASANARITMGAHAPGSPNSPKRSTGSSIAPCAPHIDGMRAQRDFQRDLSALSHDIRTPLTGAKGYLQLAADEADPALKRRRIDAAVERINRTSELLDALFSYTKASDPDLVLNAEPIDVREIVEQCLLGHYPDFERLGWEPVVTGTELRASRRPTGRRWGASWRTLVANALGGMAAAHPELRIATAPEQTIPLHLEPYRPSR
ncbi:MAG: sensor histidine kinase [Collinsella sp.]